MTQFIGAISFLWLGMVIAISFVEAPLKFRAPEVTLRIGLGIGRLVFRALNAFEAVFALLLVVAVVAAQPDRPLFTSAFAAVLVLIVQLLAVRPALTRRSDAVLSGTDTGGSRTHVVYIALEVVKVVALVAAGILSLGLTLEA